jgi:hypothetical protein
MIEQFLEPDELEPTDLLPIDTELVRSNIKEIVKAMYLTGDVAYMESCLDEVCHELDIEINKGDPVLECKGERNLMTWYLGYQRAVIDAQTNATNLMNT